MKYASPGASSEDQIAATLLFNGVQAKLGISDPQENPLHRKWLGVHARATRRRRKFYTDVFSLSCSVDNTTIHRVGAGEGMSQQLLNTGRFHLDNILTNWPAMTTSPMGVFSAESDAPFIACELHFDTIEITERMEVLQKLLGKSKPPAPASPPSPRIVGPVPRIIFDAAVTDVLVRLLPAEGASHSSLDVCCGGFGVHGRTHIREVSSVAGHPDLELGSDLLSLSLLDKYTLRTDVVAHANVEPICIRYRFDAPLP